LTDRGKEKKGKVKGKDIGRGGTRENDKCELNTFHHKLDH
jgi:hypothetical protein